MEHSVFSVLRGDGPQVLNIIIMTMYHTQAIPWGNVQVDAATGYTYSWTIEDILTQLLLIE